MCFSASASFISGGLLSTVGVATLKKVERKSEIPFAMVPLLFGFQQITEGFIWLSFRPGFPPINATMTYIYSLFSHVLWPVFLPFSILLLEPVSSNRRIIRIFQLLGTAVGLYLLYIIMEFPITSTVVNKHIVYDSPHFYIPLMMVLYFSTTCLVCIFSSLKTVRIFGALLFLFAIVANYIQAVAFFSIWCFFAAILSLIVYWYFSRRIPLFLIAFGQTISKWRAMWKI